MALWANWDGSGEHWSAHSLSRLHNDLGGVPQFPEALAPGIAHGNRSLLYGSTTAYNSLVATGDCEGMVMYDRLADGWFGPSAAQNQADAVFAMRFRVAAL